MTTPSDKPNVGYVHSIETMSGVDGPGLRCVVFTQGCLMACIYCHNPDTWAVKAGEAVSAAEVVQRIARYKPYFGAGGGVTVSGGEPLLQAEFVTELLLRCQEEGIHTALDTSGGFAHAHAKRVLDFTDLLLLDLKAPNPGVQKKLTKVDFDASLAFLAHASQRNIPVWIRYVVVPGYNDAPEHLDELASRLSHYTGIERVDLLPLHHMGRAKWAEIGMTYAIGDIPPPGPEEMRALRDRLQAALSDEVRVA